MYVQLLVELQNYFTHCMTLNVTSRFTQKQCGYAESLCRSFAAIQLWVRWYAGHITRQSARQGAGEDVSDYKRY